jgi:tripartite-type tricarboxylate transporter receptor subunit TctC
MTSPRRLFLHPATGAAALIAITVSGLALTTISARSQATRTIKIVVPFAPGGGADALGRLMADQIGQVHKLTMVVENRPGAGTLIATEAVSRAAPDGRTVLMVANSFVINPGLKKLNYDPLTSFEPVCFLTRSPNVVVVNSTSHYRSLGDLMSAARAKPGELTMAFQGPGTSQHIAFEKLKRAANIDMGSVPYLGAAPATNALLGQHVTSLFVNYPSVAEQVKAGRLRALAVASRARIESQPNVPTVAEAGHKDFEEDVWFGLVVPAKTPKDTVAQLEAWSTAALQAPDVKAKLALQELYPAGMCGADFAAHLRKQYEDYSRVIREAKITAQ